MKRALLLLLVAGCASGPQPGAIRLPPGFAISVYSDNVPQARALALGAEGTLFVGGKEKDVYAVPPGGGKAVVIATGLQEPHGVAFRDGSLYVAERSRILRFDGIESLLASPPAPVVVAELPKYKHHGLRTLRFGPDGMLYVPVGAPCNICLPEDDYALVSRLDVKTGQRHIFARGVRNSVGFDWHPQTKELWFTDNGRDLLGHDAPPDELNRAPRAGLHFGYPYCHGGDLADPELGAARACKEFEPPAAKLGAHVAALGMRFYTGAQFPAAWRGAIFIAEHGSWNRRPMSGYRITVVKLRDGRAASYETFAEGWLRGERAWGRPVDVIVAPDGALLVSDDKAGVIYRIAYLGN
ncbi:MAG: PQQ-dependent sugar dehydrogenase [Betaproteobacteria bacterium]